MKKSFQIFKRDIQRLFHNKVAMIVMAGVCVLPSLYAWFNIAANMDPYSNTQGIKVAIANNDEGAKNEMLSLNAGDSIVENLEENDQLGWTFVDENKAVEGVRSGKYYAAIVIPDNFSASLLSVISGEPRKAQLSYYINEKKNAIAPKITDTVAGTVQQEINDTFSSVAAETISKLIQSSVTKVSGDMNQMNTDVMSMLDEIQGNLDQYQKILKNFQDTAGSSSTLIDDSLATLDGVKSAANSGAAAFDDSNSLLQGSRNSIGQFSTTFSQNLSDGENRLNDIYGSASDRLSSLKSQAETINGVIGNGIDSVGSLVDLNNRLLGDLQELSSELQSKLPDGALEGITAKVDQAIADLEAQNGQYEEFLSSLNDGNANVENALTTADGTKKQLETLISQSRESLKGYRNSFDQSLLPQLNQSLDTFASLSGSLSATLSGVSASAEQMKDILNQLKGSLTDSVHTLGQTGEAISSLGGRLSQVTTDLKALQSSQAYKKFISLEGLDADSIADFMQSPVTIESETLYSVENYGSSMTPFYTNLALWVGGIVLISILKLEVDKDEKVHKFSTTSAYFGRWMLFMVLGLIQGLIVCLGDLWLLKVQCLHPAAFVLAGMFCSFIYVNLIYALAITFKHIGKALCVVLVILQIPGSAGTYPIEMTPAFFQKLHPLLPFTYGINAMREAIAGMYQHEFAKNLLCLAVYLPIAFVIGLGLRVLLMNLNYLFDKKLSETDLMLAETQAEKRERTQLTLVVKALMGDKTLREEIVAKAAVFEAGYQRQIRIGFAAMLILPLIFLVLMFSIESKIVFLVLWIVSLIIIAVYLICLEYIHERLKRQIQIGELTQEELLKAMKGRDDE